MSNIEFVARVTDQMEDRYTHSSYTLLQTTELIREVVDHVLGQPASEVPAELRSELASWRDGDEGERREKGSDSVEDVSSTVSFDLVKRAHKQLAKTPLGNVYSRVGTVNVGELIGIK